MAGRPRILVATFPAQGHINPSLQFAKKLIKMGSEVTFLVSDYASQRIAGTTGGVYPKGLTVVSIPDGFGQKPAGGDEKRHMEQMKNRGLKAVRDTLLAGVDQGHRFSCLVYSHLFAAAAQVAREMQTPSALLWIEPATVLDIYYFYFNGYKDEIDKGEDIKLPGLPRMAQRDLPTFLLPSMPERFRLFMKEKLDILDAEGEKPKVLINTFDALEPYAINAIDKYEMVGIGPLIPSAYLDGLDPSDRSFGGDLVKKSGDSYLQWLSTKSESSVVYVSFGSGVMLPVAQLEEIAEALLECGRPFLWVVRVNEDKERPEEVETLSCFSELIKLGKILTWCSQLEVLTHPSLGCFVTHCGWNSVLESIALGVPVVAFPQCFDQGTNAKLIEDVWRTGVRVNTNEDKCVGRDEIRSCIEVVMDGGERSQEMRENAKKWKGLAMETMKENGASNKNIKAFLDELDDHEDNAVSQ